MANLNKVKFALENCMKFRCDLCPYADKNGAFGTCYEKMLHDMLDVIKEQEPRVMTLEEARETMQTADLMYCEDKNDDTMAGGLVLGMRTDVFWDLANGEYMDFDDLGYFGKLAGEYGKSFRFWTSRPTPEQMRDTKWEGEQ